MKSTLEQWRMLQAVVTHGGFSQAAEVVHKSQSTIHHAVHKLEDLLGVKLLEVRGRKAILTDDGELMLRRASYVLNEASKLEDIAKNLSRGVESRLNIAVDEAFPQHLIYQALATVSAEYPHLRVEIHETVLSGTEDIMRKGIADLGISGFALSQYTHQQLCHVTFVAVAHPDHPLHQLENISFEDLKSHRQIVIRDSGIHQQRDVGWLGAEQRWTVSNLRTSIDLISKGFGFAWLPAPEVGALMQEGKLKMLPLSDGRARDERFYLNIRDPDQLGPAGRAFIERLHQSIQDEVSKNKNEEGYIF